MRSKEGNIGDFPYQKQNKKDTEILGPFGVQSYKVEKKASSFPGIGRKGGEGKYFKEHVELVRQQKVEKAIENKINELAQRKNFNVKKMEGKNFSVFKINRQNNPLGKVVFKEKNIFIKSEKKPPLKFSYEDKDEIINSLENYF